MKGEAMKLTLKISILLISIMAFPTIVLAKTLVVEGRMDGTVAIRKNVSFFINKPLEWFTYQIPVPATYDTAGNLQRLDGFQATFNPQPSGESESTDEFGNRYRKLVWRKLSSDLHLTITYTTEITANLNPRTTNTPFPLPPLPEQELAFLKSSKLAQSDAPQIVQLARELTAGATTQLQAVSSILTCVADSITYQYSPKQYDALFGLTTGAGNCQNFAHLAVALLRASGIPARVVIGQSLKNNWKIPMDKRGSSLVQGMGEGMHAWIEIYYPNLGWLPCDPQQSRFFTSTRHIKFGHGLDARDVSEYWQGSPELPRMSESFEANYLNDNVDLKLRETYVQPSHYMVSAPVAIREPLIAPTPVPTPAQILPLPAPPTPVPGIKKPSLPAKLKPGTALEIGNRDFPPLVELYQVEGNIGRRGFDRETAEYVTSHYLYAQAFSLDTSLALKDVALAMRRFGGDGMIYLDLALDDNGKPSRLEGFRSKLVSLERITRRPGYYWVDFTLPDNTTLAPGKYWLVLRHSGEAIMNWFYTPGKRVNGPDDTRSTARGWQWEDLLAGEFVYRVRGVVK